MTTKLARTATREPSSDGHWAQRLKHLRSLWEVERAHPAAHIRAEDAGVPDLEADHASLQSMIEAAEKALLTFPAPTHEALLEKLDVCQKCGLSLSAEVWASIVADVRRISAGNRSEDARSVHVRGMSDTVRDGLVAVEDIASEATALAKALGWGLESVRELAQDAGDITPIRPWLLGQIDALCEIATVQKAHLASIDAKLEAVWQVEGVLRLSAEGNEQSEQSA